MEGGGQLYVCDEQRRARLPGGQRQGSTPARAAWPPRECRKSKINKKQKIFDDNINFLPFSMSFYWLMLFRPTRKKPIF
jgi:hypothetical protein